VHLVGFTIRIYHDARSPERQTVLRHVSVAPTTTTTCYESSCLFSRLPSSTSYVKYLAKLADLLSNSNSSSISSSFEHDNVPSSTTKVGNFSDS